MLSIFNDSCSLEKVSFCFYVGVCSRSYFRILDWLERGPWTPRKQFETDMETLMVHSFSACWKFEFWWETHQIQGGAWFQLK